MLPSRSATRRRASSRSPEGNRREALHHGRRRAGRRKGTTAKRSTTKVVEQVPWTGNAAKRSNTGASSRCPERDRREAFDHEGRRAGPRTGLPLIATPRRASSRSLDEERREALHHGGRLVFPRREPSLNHGARGAGAQKGTAAKRSTTKGVERVPGNGMLRSAPPRRSSSRSPERNSREALHHRWLCAADRKGNAAKRSTTERVETVPERDIR